ncbi:DUF2806 domain-containing protein [Mesorhizobium sp. LMG17149]|uniref:DUF2806 domain-containing protein n=1 Tax=Mesorhizobium sp. LMG17149 TaxID=2968497 RepID=UPI0021197C5F|nr:DUF2806 domain-containing protein [Mesorhizobium sp. LMG17149]MCQ8873603.1 DUF2806 domain-containing protein [Mesorhizobium sp. LMG17149]
MNNDDPLDKTTEISGELTESGIKGKTNLRALAAIDRLLGNVLDYFNPRLEDKARVERAITDGKVLIIEALAQDRVREVGRSRDYKEINTIEVVRESIKELAAPTATNNASDETDVEIDPDWLNYFESYSEKASTTNMRSFWGRILSGEIRRPGSFSLTTLRVASELTQQTAKDFQELVKLRMDGFVFSSEKEPRLGFDALMQLQAAGLIQGVEGTGVIGTPPTTDGEKYPAVMVQSKVVLFHTKHDIAFSGYILSAAGEELAALLPIDAQGTIDFLVKSAPKVAKITLNEIRLLSDDEWEVGGEIAILKSPKPKDDDN